MPKETFADKMAKKAFFEPEFQKSWAVHMGAFGPILEPAFAQDYQARVHLAAALNRISRRDLKGGLEKLDPLRERCQTNADKAAWLFFMGLCFDLAGDSERMLAFYRLASEYQHRFYMPYVKMAKFFQAGHLYDRAAQSYHDAIRCYDGMGLGEKEKLILSSAYAGLATCQTMMHRYEEAERTLETSRQLCGDGPGRSAVEAVLYAALGRREKVDAALKVLLTHAPQVYAEIRDTAQKILNGTEPMFCPVETDKAALAAFWGWFRSAEESLSADPEESGKHISDHLNSLFPVAEGAIEAAVLPERKVLLPDTFFVALNQGYRELLELCPGEITDGWSFEIVPYVNKQKETASE